MGSGRLEPWPATPLPLGARAGRQCSDARVAVVVACLPEMTMGQRVTRGSSGSTNLSGSRGSRVSTRDPLTHDQVNKIPRTGYFVAVMMFDFESTST